MAKFLVASSLRHAITEAQIDRNWQRVDYDKFIDDKGDEVKLLACSEMSRMLRGVQKIEIYQGWGYSPTLDEVQWLEYMRRTGQLTYL